MKKIFLIASAVILTFSSCRKDDDNKIETVAIETQNAYDDEAIVKFMDEYYFDQEGNITKFSSTDASDDLYPKLSSYSPVKLPSGVVYIVRPNAQPVAGKAIGSHDKIKLMGSAQAFIAKKTDGNVKFESGFVFRNTIGGSGMPENDPFYYYANKSIRTTYGKERPYFEIEGFREALQNFQSFEIPDSDNYNLQGVILVPSRAAYARDENINDLPTARFHDRSFIFNFQVYQTTQRPSAEM